MKFDTSKASHEFIEKVYARVGARNQAVLGRAALFLALGEGVPSEFKPLDSRGVTLNDEQVVGDELKDVVRSALNHRAGKTLDESGYRQEFRRHFEFGCKRLAQIWEESGNDQASFVSALLKLTTEFSIADRPKPISLMPIIEEEVKLKVLTDAPEWSINGPGTSNGLLVISGQPGSGKSQLALDLLAQLANYGVRFVFFDMKGELEDDPANEQQRVNRKRFLNQTGAQHVRLIRQALPINPFYRDPNAAVNAQIANEVTTLIRAFAPQLGPNQQQALSDAYQELTAPDFASLLEKLKQNGGTGVHLSIVKRIVDCNLFASAQNSVSPEQWLSQSLVIDFKEFGTDTNTKALAVALILNFLIKKMSQQLATKNGIQPLKMVLFVDESHLLLPKENKAGLLSRLARQGRSWGFPVWLASQDADKFITAGIYETNFAELAECGIHFSPQSLNSTEQKQVLGYAIHENLKKGEAVLRLQGKLQIGIARQFWKDGGK